MLLQTYRATVLSSRVLLKIFTAKYIPQSKRGMTLHKNVLKHVNYK